MFLFLFTTVFAADPKYKLGDATHTTKWSWASMGSYTLTPEKFGSGGDYEGLYKIVAWEHKDFSCRLDIHSRHLNTYNTKVDYADKCTGKAKGKKIIEFSKNDTFISGVQFCYNGRDGDDILGGRTEQLKGLRVWSRQLNRTTGGLKEKIKKEWTRPNCREWGKERHCPAGQIAWKIDLLQSEQGTFKIRLLCKKVIEK